MARRMAKEWNGTLVSLAAFTVNATSLGGLLAFAIPGTILRMIGEYVIQPTAAPTNLDLAFVAIGIGIVSTDAATLGATAMPDPSDEPEFPWLYWQEHALRYNGVDPEAANAGASVRRSFDIKSMRRFKPGQSLAVISQYVDNVGAPPLTFVCSRVRVLLAT